MAVVTPKRGGEARELVLPGNVEAFYSASIHGQVKGYVQEWRKDIGAKVQQGDVLAVVDTPELDQSIAVAQSELAKAKANLALAKVTAARWNSLRASAAVSQQAADEKDSDPARRAAEVDAAAGERRPAEGAEGLRQHRGAVRRRRHRPQRRRRLAGQGGRRPTARPCSPSPTFTRCGFMCAVPEIYAAELKDGMKATLELPEYPDRKFDATIATTSHAIDQKSRTLLVELLADNKDGLLAPGAFARVHFRTPA